MKNKTLSIMLMLLSMTCFFTGCGVTAATSDNDTVSSESISTTSVQAYETNEELSAEAQEQEEDERRNEVAEQYSIYKEYGLSYDKDKDRFFYDGNMVRYFSDTVSKENTNAFFYEDGVIDLNPIRDSSGKLMGLEIASDEEFAARTEKFNEINATLQSIGASESGAYEGGDPGIVDDSLEGYEEFGISYDTKMQKWVYERQQIYFFYDPNGITYIDGSVVDGVSLRVVRDENQNIEKIIETTADEVNQILN